MLNLFRPSLNLSHSSKILGVLYAFFALSGGLTAHAQVTAVSRQLERLDVAVSGTGVITKGVAGFNYLGQDVTQNASTTLGTLVQVRYTKSPLMGLEFNYSYARFDQNYVCSSCSAENFPNSPFSVQANTAEYTLGYVAHLPSIFGVQPFGAAGGGLTAFKPTPNGGEGLPEAARWSYYYDVGVDDQFFKFVGFRAQFRQVFYQAPNFLANYLETGKQTFTTQPSIGVYVKF